MIRNNKQLPVSGMIVLVMMLGAFACSPVKEYQKSKLNDGEMTLSNRRVEKTELNFQSYREGASGANSGKTGGGCGCN
ncbi:DUF4266 domain-containing protein [Pseudoflavitalea rhizosphaerae]|uniref:DUF4266 domain-containing protein n=1 Tax=Pseudoflavitalea rhizosphaerae TaxID=1884793 RepID=UPI0013DEEABD|nr:DUF4266 domain-containing protein [Pseudoflavitalea rhizosphaerae]